VLHQKAREANSGLRVRQKKKRKNQIPGNVPPRRGGGKKKAEKHVRARALEGGGGQRKTKAKKDNAKPEKWLSPSAGRVNSAQKRGGNGKEKRELLENWAWNGRRHRREIKKRETFLANKRKGRGG